MKLAMIGFGQAGGKIVSRSAVDVARAYWWFPALNTVVGTVLTLGALWRILPLTEVIA